MIYIYRYDIYIYIDMIYIYDIYIYIYDIYIYDIYIYIYHIYIYMTWHDMTWHDMIWYIYIHIIISSSRDPWPSWPHGWGGQLTEPKWICWGRLWMLQQLLLPHIDDIWAGFVQPKLPLKNGTNDEKPWDFWGTYPVFRQTQIILLVWCCMIIWRKIQWLHPNFFAPLYSQYFRSTLSHSSMIDGKILRLVRWFSQLYNSIMP